MAAARAAKQAYLQAIMFAPTPSFPGAEFGLAAPVILPQPSASLSAIHCRSSAGSNTFDLTAPFGGALPVPAGRGGCLVREDVPPGLASLLQAAEIAQCSRGPPQPRLTDISTCLSSFQQHQHQQHSGGVPLGSSTPSSSFTCSANTVSSALPAGTPEFLAFLHESGSVLASPTAGGCPTMAVSGTYANNTTTQSALNQLVLLQHWIPILDRMSPVHKNLLWETCKMFPGFRVTTPKLTSYRKVVSAWGANIASYVANITALFAAIGYLKHHDILKNEFFFPNTQQPVFRSFIPSMPGPPPPPPAAAAAAAPMRSSGGQQPTLKRPNSTAVVVAVGAPPSPSPAAPLSPMPADDRGRDRSPDVEDMPAPVKRSRVMNIATLTMTDSNTAPEH